MIDYLLIAAIGGRMQQARLLQDIRFRDRRKEEEAFYARTGSSSPLRFLTRLLLPADRTVGGIRCDRAKMDDQIRPRV